MCIRDSYRTMLRRTTRISRRTLDCSGDRHAIPYCRWRLNIDQPHDIDRLAGQILEVLVDAAIASDVRTGFPVSHGDRHVLLPGHLTGGTSLIGLHRGRVVKLSESSGVSPTGIRRRVQPGPAPR